MVEFLQGVREWMLTTPAVWRITVILIVTLILNMVLRKLLTGAVNRWVNGVERSQNQPRTKRFTPPGYPINERSVQRAKTLGSIGRNVITWVLGMIAFVMVLTELGVNVTAILASAGVVGAGLAFGAQNIVKDFLNGIFMAFEDQLGVGDLVTVDQVTGTVEDVGLRVTQIRAYDGTLWFVRNGEILTLGNISQGWGRAIIDITVDATENLAKVEEVAIECGKELIADPAFASRVTGEPELLGLESIYGDRATVRLSLQTKPSAQYAVQRELRSIVKRVFAEREIVLATELPKGLNVA